MSILALPPVPLAMVAENLPSSDLIHIRRAHRIFRDVTQRRFGRTYFANLSHIFTEQSLRVLLGIARIPEFRKQVEVVSFTAVMVEEEKFDSMPPGWKTMVQLGWPLQCPELGGVGQIRSSEIQSRLLRDALRCFAANSEPPQILYQSQDDMPYATGLNRLRRDLNIAPSDLKPTGGDSPPTTLMNGILPAGYPLESLEFDLASNFYSLSCRVFDGYHHNRARAAGCWHSLTSLSLALVPPSDEWAFNSTVAIRGVLADAHNLTDLTLQSNEADDLSVPMTETPENFMSVIVASVASRRLDTVSLTGFWTKLADLRTFVESHRHTLRDLKLFLLSLSENESWKTFLTLLAERAHLENLDFNDLLKGDDPAYHDQEFIHRGSASDNYNHGQWVRLIGRELVRSRLRVIVREGEYIKV